MYFNHFLALSNVPTGDLKYFWPYNSSSGSGDFTPPKQETLPNSSGYNKFSFFISANKLNSGGCVLVSTQDTSKNGFTFGYTDNNQFYIDNYSNNSYETFIFKDIDLSKKNTFCLQRNDNTFSVYNYDLISQEIYQAQSFSFKNNYNLSGLNYSIGGTPNHPIYSGNRFSGEVDQMAFFCDFYSTERINSLFSGFLPLTGLASSGYTGRIIAEEKISYPDNIHITGINYSYIYDYLLNFNNTVRNQTGDGVGFITGQNNLLVSWSASGHYGQESSLNPCIYQNPSGYSYFSAGLPSGTFSFVDNVNYSVGVSGGIFINHSLKFDYPLYSTDNFTINHSFFDKWGTINYISGGAIYSNYYNNYYMEGVSSLNVDSILLGTRSGEAPNGFSITPNIDNVNGNFYSEIVPGSVYKNGTNTEFSSLGGGFYSLSGLSYGDSVLFDKFIGFTPLHYGLSGYALGQFRKRASVVFSGDNSWSEFYRKSPKSYKETTSFNLYHGKPINTVKSGESFENNQNYWS